VASITLTANCGVPPFSLIKMIAWLLLQQQVQRASKNCQERPSASDCRLRLASEC
jgi:hypothetical protein